MAEYRFTASGGCEFIASGGDTISDELASRIIFGFSPEELAAEIIKRGISGRRNNDEK